MASLHYTGQDPYAIRTYRIVPAGEESLYIDFDAEVTELLSQA